MTPWLSGRTLDSAIFNADVREFESRRERPCLFDLSFIHTLRTEKSACPQTVRRSHLPKLTPWRPSKRCNPAIRRGVLKKSPTVLYGALSLGWALSEKQPAAPSMDELWNRICSGKHLAGELSRMGPITLACAIIPVQLCFCS